MAKIPIQTISFISAGECDQVSGNYLSEVMTLGVRSSLVFKDEMQGGARHHFLTSELAFL